MAFVLQWSATMKTASIAKTVLSLLAFVTMLSVYACGGAGEKYTYEETPFPVDVGAITLALVPGYNGLGQKGEITVDLTNSELRYSFSQRLAGGSFEIGETPVKQCESSGKMNEELRSEILNSIKNVMIIKRTPKNISYSISDVVSRNITLSSGEIYTLQEINCVSDHCSYLDQSMCEVVNAVSQRIAENDLSQCPSEVLEQVLQCN